jgi:hypothetical protein
MKRQHPNSIVFAAALLIVLFLGGIDLKPTPVHSQPGRSFTLKIPTGYLGISLQGGKGYFVGTQEEGNRTWVFLSEPRVWKVDQEGPSGGKLEVGDLILTVNGQSVAEIGASKRLQYPEPGEELVLTVRRNGKEKDFTIMATKFKLDEDIFSDHEIFRVDSTGTFSIRSPLPSKATSTMVTEVQSAEPRVSRTRSWFGLGLETGGIVVTHPGQEHAYIYFDNLPQIYSVDKNSPAARAGLQRGDVITHINSLPLDRDEGGRLFSSVEPGEEIEFVILRNGKSQAVTLVAEEHPEIHLVKVHTPVRFIMRELEDREKHLRYAGTLGDTDIEVRGVGEVSVTKFPTKISISTGDITVRLTRRDAEYSTRDKAEDSTGD